MQSSLLIALLLVFISEVYYCAKPTLDMASTQGVFGGRVKSIEVVALSTLQSRVFIATESANSAFYADVSNSTGSIKVSKFSIIPQFNSANFGKDLGSLHANGNLSTLFVGYNGAVYAWNWNTFSLTNIVNSTMVRSFTTHNGRLYALVIENNNLKLRIGSISAGNTFVQESNQLVLPIDVTDAQLFINPVNQKIFIFSSTRYSTSPFSSSLTVLMSNEFISYNGTFSWTYINTTSLVYSNIPSWSVFGIRPSDGALFVGSSTSASVGGAPGSKVLAYATPSNPNNWTLMPTGVNGVAGSSIAFSQNSIFFGSAMSTNNGTTWSNFGTVATHPNDGPVTVDPNFPNVVYITTDAGLGWSINSGVILDDINDGIEAVTINDLKMNQNKTIAWSASKSGIRRVTNYMSVNQTWSTYWPMNDGSPYYSVGLHKYNVNTVYVGNSRLYKTQDSGNSWNRLFEADVQVTFSSVVSAIAVHPSILNITFIGVSTSAAGFNGGIWYTFDGGDTFTRVTTGTAQTHVKSILIVEESPTVSKIYVGCEYKSSGSYGVKILTLNTVTKTIVYQNDMIDASSGIAITNFGANSLAINSKNAVFACGTDSSNSQPVVYLKPAASASWIKISTNNITINAKCTALTVGVDRASHDLPIIAVGTSLYYLDRSGWNLGATYPAGTEINVLYWDDLLVGTGSGLYGQGFNATIDEFVMPNVVVSSAITHKVMSIAITLLLTMLLV